ncbi:hypothetical protein [Vibrio navarrensis]|uniref:hypothetical protein n=1 Tax=Vibrio navarrensis TaxID=29495 RepID=UPI0018673F64|nr:hypothetical protein [Vibrio navarrensis]
MEFELRDLSRTHTVVLAARLMQYLFPQYDGMYWPCRIVLERFPELTKQQVMCLWVGINIESCSLEELESIELRK